MSSADSLKTASVLAFERKLDVSDGLFYGGKWEAREEYALWKPLEIQEKSIRGTISNRATAAHKKDPAKLNADIQKPNLQRVDFCALRSEEDTLCLRYTLRVLPAVHGPAACNNSAYQAKLLEMVQGYSSEVGFAELGLRYAMNLANGRYLWRNRLSAEMLDVRISHVVEGMVKQSWSFNGFNVSVKEFSSNEKVDELGQVIAAGLAGDSRYTLLEVVAFARCGLGQEVYPSQELILDRGKEMKSKTLYSVQDVAGMHSQKLGNAIRTIDTWYPDSAEFGPIPVEPYGAVTSMGRAFRQPKDKMDFYSFLDKWALKDEKPAVEQQHFVMANFIRGGVFGGKE